MISTLAPDLLQGPARDTMVAVTARDGLGLAVDVSLIVVAVALVVMGLALARLLIRADRTLKDVRVGVRQGLGPVSERARSISDNVEFITHALRADVERLNASVKALTDRLHQASNRMEERIEEFNALMEVVQGEAEEIFIDAASTVRGVREGARSIASPAPSLEDQPLSERESDIPALPGETSRPAPSDPGRVRKGTGHGSAEDGGEHPSATGGPGDPGPRSSRR